MGLEYWWEMIPTEAGFLRSTEFSIQAQPAAAIKGSEE